MRRTSILLNEDDDLAIENIRKKYGLESDSSVVRFALRILSNQPMVSIGATENFSRVVENIKRSDISNSSEVVGKKDSIIIQTIDNDMIIRKVYVLADKD